MTRHNPNLMRASLAAWLVAWLLMAISPAQAHNVTVFAWVEAGKVHTESKFSGGRRVKDGKIEVFDHHDQIVHTGTTNHQGDYSFAVPAGAKTLKIVLTAGMGHTNQWTIQAQELGASTNSQTAKANPDQPAPPLAAAPSTEPMATIGLNAQDMEMIVEKALERKLAPIRAQLAEQSWGLRDILAGLGYILGLMGLASYVHHRRHAPPDKKS